jgi:ABC-type transporter lipoprotein component MlaA
MPAGDAGLEQDERERILTTLRQYGAASGQYVHPWYVPALFDALAYLVENTPVAQAAQPEGERA